MTSTPALPHFNVHDVEMTPIPQFGGGEAILYSSDDGRRLAGSFRESGTHTITMAYDEFLYVVAGSVKLTVKGQDTIELTSGDCAYIREGEEVLWEMSDDFHDVTVLISDTAISY